MEERIVIHPGASHFVYGEVATLIKVCLNGEQFVYIGNRRICNYYTQEEFENSRIQTTAAATGDMEPCLYTPLLTDDCKCC